MKPTKRPLVTIGVTTYDRPKLLRECVSSILAQSYESIEIIIGNDYVPVPVTFESLGIAPDSRIRIINHPQNIGAYRNNYYLLSAASGDWFTWLADDDLMHSEFLEIAWEVFSSNAVSAVLSDYVAAASPDGLFPLPVRRTPPRIFTGTEFFRDYTARSFRTVGSYGVFHRDLYARFPHIKRFGTGLPVYGDTFLPLFAAAHGQVAFVDQRLIFLRTHVESRSATSSRLPDYASAQSDFIAAFKEYCEPQCTPAEFQRNLSNMVRWFSADSWAVICRADDRLWQQMCHFYRHAKSVLLPIVDTARRPALAAEMATMVAMSTARCLATRILKDPNTPC